MSRRTFYAFIVAFVLLSVVVVVNRLSFNEMRNYSVQVDHTHQVITTFESISNDFKSAQIYTNTYLNTPQRDFYQLYWKDVNQLSSELQQLKVLVKDNPVQVKVADSLSDLIHSQIGELKQKNIAELIATGQAWRLDYFLRTHEIINRGIEHENILLKERYDKLTSFTHLTNILTTVFAIIAITTIVLTFLFNLFIEQKRRRLEGLLETILDTSQNAIVHYKAIKEHGKIKDFHLEYANNAVKDLFGQSADKVVGKRLSEIQGVTPGMFERMTKVIDTGEPLAIEYQYRNGDFQQYIYALFAKTEEGVTGTFHNITPLKQYEEELKENIKDLEQSNTELEQYAYIASHDLQEPLRKIRSFGSYLIDTQSNKLDQKGKEQLKKMIAAAEKMSVLIKDILTFSSLKKEDSFQHTDLNTILNSVLEDLDLVIQQKGALIKVDELPTIEAIPLQINQLFYNLLTNSLKFTQEGRTPAINIHSETILSNESLPFPSLDQRYFKITFQDNGIGFNPDYGEQIFGLFKRLNDKQTYPGSGIGLALCKKVAQNHNGDIFASGELGKGARFTVYLPEKQGEREAASY